MTSNVSSWPSYEPDELLLGDPESSVGVCCLWTDRRRLAGGLDASRYAALGNLYSAGGIGLLVRNLLANPRLRYLVVCGADFTGSGGVLLALFERGLDTNHGIAGTNVPFDSQVPAEAIEGLRARIQVVDQRGVSDVDKINEVLQALPPLPPVGEPLLFPEQTPSFETLPSEGAGYLVRQASIARAWLECLQLVTTFGESTQDEAGRPLKELCDVMAVLSEPAERLGFPSWLPCRREEADQLAGELWSGASLDGRLRLGAAGSDQAGNLATRLRAGAVSGLAGGRDPARNTEGASLPCILSASVHARQLVLTAFCRGLELGRFWPLAALALRIAHGRVAEAWGMSCAPLVVVTQSAYLYREAEPGVLKVLAQHGPRLLPWQADPRGVLHIRLADGQILVEHGIQDIGRSGRRFSGTSAQRLYKAVVNAKLVLLPEHAAYLGAELQKAETALRLGVSYRQDEPLDFSGRPDQC